MNLEFAVKEPDKAYLSNRLWLPKAGIRTDPVKRALEFVVNGGPQGQVLMRMWNASTSHIICPREFLPSSEYSKFKFPFVDLRPEFQRVEFEEDIQPRDAEQIAAWESLTKNDNGILNLACGKGKALAHGQRVLTTRGFVPVEQVTVEDQTAGTDGRFHQVVGVFPQGERDIYRVSFTDGTHLDCDGDHRWTLVMRRTKEKSVVTLTTRELLEKSLRGTAGRLYYLPPIAPVERQPGVFKVDPYTLGALLGDGHLSHPPRVMFTTADGEMLSMMKLPPYHRFMVAPGGNSGRATTYRISMSRKDTSRSSGERLVVLLAELGLMGHTAHSKFVPNAYKYSSSWERLAVIQGLLDTDGSPTASGAAEYSTVSTQLADDVTDMVLSLGGTCTRQHRVTTCKGKSFKSLRLLVKLPQGMPLFRLSRKLKKLPPSRQREPYRAVDSIVCIGKGLATCISVNSADHLFLAESYIPTHNTILAVKKIAQRGVPALVIVPDGGIMSQWQEAVARHLRFEGELGIVQGPVFNWAKPVTLALVTTLWKRIEDGAIPEEMFRYFGQVIYDEVHQIGAPKFSLTAEQFYGDRIGLTATVQREDGLDPVYRYHIGEPFFSDLSQDLIPDIFFQQTPARLPYEDARVNGSTNISILRTILGHDLVANTFRYWHIHEALNRGRKILVLSHSKAQLRLFHAMFPGSALIIAETEKEERMQILRDSQICFAISKLGSTGVDDDQLDTLFWLTPFRSKIALQQSMGRIQRFKEGKRKPVMVIFEDWLTPPIKNMCNAVKADLRKWHYAFTVVKPNNMPRELPPEIREIYERRLAELRPDEDTGGESEDGVEG